MTLESKVKTIMLTGAIDIIVKGAYKSPERCARSLIELGERTFPNILTKSQIKELYTKFLTLCENHELPKLKELFFLTYNCLS